MTERLHFDNVSISVGDTPTVFDVTLSIEAHSLHVLMGPNGSGKSTLLNAVMGHPRYKVTGGRLTIDDDDLTSLDPEEKARKGLMLSMQYPPEIAGVTLLNFLHRAHRALHSSEDSVFDFYREVEAIAQSIGVDASFLKRPVGTGLSGGEKKQAEILQLLALKPKFVLLDEIDSGVDVDAMKKILRGIEMLRSQGVGLLIVTHYGATLKDLSPDVVHVLHSGRIVATGDNTLATRVTTNGFEDFAPLI